MTFSNWLDTFVDEKGIDREHLIEVEGASGYNLIPVECLLEAIKGAPKNEKDGIKSMIVKLDFLNRPIMPYFEHLAKAISI